MQTITLSRWGNSLGLRLPKGVIEGQRLHAGDKVTVELVGGDIVVRKKVEPRKYKLSEILGCFRPATETGELDWGSPRGQEFGAEEDN